jgi:hypothetical protein
MHIRAAQGTNGNGRNTHSTILLKALLDNSATELFIDQKFVHQNSLKT